LAGECHTTRKMLRHIKLDGPFLSQPPLCLFNRVPRLLSPYTRWQPARFVIDNARVMMICAMIMVMIHTGCL
jgi:hypothetical protein